MHSPSAAREPISSGEAIRVRVRLFASYREAAGTARLELTLPSSTRARELLALLAERIPALTAARGMIAVNQQYVTPEHVLQDGDEVAFIPPVSGG